jgi:alkylation response protein AidB-like acyl-CoA dehydrogenase
VDFDFTDEQRELRELAARIFTDMADHAQQRRVETEGEDPRFDKKLWSALAGAGLLGLSLPEDQGGAGLGFLETCIVIEEAGRAAAPVPLTAATVFGALPVARFADPETARRWLARAGNGEAILTGSLGAVVGDPLRPAATATAGEGPGQWHLRGVLDDVPAGLAADAVVVAATAEAGTGLFLVDPGSPGVTRRRQDATDSRVEAQIELDGVLVEPADVLVAPGPAGERVQFGKPVATFQAVGQRAADAYIDAEGVRLTAWQAAWRLDRDLPAAAEVAVAKFWADDGAQRVVHGAQHLHGGVGVDRDYPLHRYYLLVKHLAPMLGGTTASLLRLGDLLADAPA